MDFIEPIVVMGFVVLLTIIISGIIFGLNDKESKIVAENSSPPLSIEEKNERSRLFRNRIYLAWCLVHLVLFMCSHTFACLYENLIGNHCLNGARFQSEFFPFTELALEYPRFYYDSEKTLWFVMKDTYDYLELIIYTTTPILIYHFWKKKII